MMKKYLLFFLAVLLLTFSTSAQNKVRYGKKEYYYLSGTEHQQGIDSLVLLKYNPYNLDINHQVPLNRYVVAKDYVLYVGLAVYNTPEEMNFLYMNDVNNYDVLKNDNFVFKNNFYYRILTKYNGEYNYKIIFKTKKSGYTVVLNYVSSNRELLTEFYDNEEFFKNKFHKKIKR